MSEGEIMANLLKSASLHWGFKKELNGKYKCPKCGGFMRKRKDKRKCLACGYYAAYCV